MKDSLQRCIVALLLLWFSHGVAWAAPVPIHSGPPWFDTAGDKINAHGGGMIQVGDTYYWFGEDKAGENANNTSFQHVPCYSSTDLAHWTFVNYVLTRQDNGLLDQRHLRVMFGDDNLVVAQ